MQEFLFEEPPADTTDEEALRAWWKKTKVQCEEALSTIKTHEGKLNLIRRLAAFRLSGRLIGLLITMSPPTVVMNCSKSKIKLHGDEEGARQRNRLLQQIAREGGLSTEEEDIDAQQLLAARREDYERAIIETKRIPSWSTWGPEAKLRSLALNAKTKDFAMRSFLHQNPDLVERHELQDLLAPSR